MRWTYFLLLYRKCNEYVIISYTITQKSISRLKHLITLACCSNRSRCTAGSFSSVYALTISFFMMNNSNLSVRPWTERCHLARGLMICGWSQINVGLMHLSSKNSPTNWNKKCVISLHNKLCCTIHCSSLHSQSCLSQICSCPYMLQLRNRNSIPGGTKRYFFCPKCPNQLWCPPNPLYNG